MSFRARTWRKSFVIEQSSLSYLASTIALALRIRKPSTSQTITTLDAGSFRYLLRFQSTPWLPTPINPTVILLLGASAPNSEEGTIQGRATLAVVPRRKRRREIRFIKASDVLCLCLTLSLRFLRVTPESVVARLIFSLEAERLSLKNTFHMRVAGSLHHFSHAL